MCGQPIGKVHRKRGSIGIDGNKKIKGRKRHILVDTLGILIAVLVHPANWSDSQGGKELIKTVSEHLKRMQLIFADQGYQEGFISFVEQLGWRVEIKKPENVEMRGVWGEKETEKEVPRGFQVLPKRWVVERTFGWLGRNRRLSKEYDMLPASSEAWCWLAMARILLRRLFLSG